jgi:hypothetical protein
MAENYNEFVFLKKRNKATDTIIDNQLNTASKKGLSTAADAQRILRIRYTVTRLITTMTTKGEGRMQVGPVLILDINRGARQTDGLVTGVRQLLSNNRRKT